MTTGSAKPSAGIIASAIVALLGSVIAILVGGLMALTGLAFSTSAAVPPPDQPLPSIAVIALMAGVEVGLGLWGIVSAVGLVRLQNWARQCFVVFGSLLAFLSFGSASGLLLAAIAQPSTLPPNVSPDLFRAILLGFTVISVMGFAIAIWWLVYFNRASVKAQFGTGAVASEPRQFPLAVSIIAWIFIVGGVMTAVQMLFSYPLMLFGIVLRGWASSLTLALMAAISLSSGIGLLKKRAEAHSLAVGYSAFGILNLLSYLVLPGSFARMQEVFRETQPDQTPGLSAASMNSFLVFSMLVGLVFTSAMLVLLIRERRPFLDACRGNTEDIRLKPDAT
jgi:hypothetical protein